MNLRPLPTLIQDYPEGWFEWIQVLETRARALHAWHLIDPSLEDSPADAPERPVQPDASEILKLLQDEYLGVGRHPSKEVRSRAHFRYDLLKIENEIKWREFDHLYRCYKDQEALLLRVHEMIVMSVETAFVLRAFDQLSETYTTRQLVKKLRELVAPTETHYRNSNFVFKKNKYKELTVVLPATR